MAYKYPNILKAVTAFETTSRWDIADAVLQDIPMGSVGVENDADQKLKDAATELANAGFDFEWRTLKEYRRLAHAFPKAKRLAFVGMDAHAACGNWDRFQAVNAQWQKDPRSKQTQFGGPLPKGKTRPLPLREARRICDAMDDAERARREDAHAEYDTEYAAKRQTAQADLDAANAKLNAAKDAVARAGNNERARNAAIKARQQAEKDQKAAQTQRETIRPQVDPNYVAPAEEMPMLVFWGRLRHKAAAASKLAEEAMEEIIALGKRSPDDTFLAALQESVMTAVNDWRRVKDALDNLSPVASPRGHLMVVEK